MARKLRVFTSIVIGLLILAPAIGFATRGQWWPALRKQILVQLGAEGKAGDAHGIEEKHDHAGHDELNSIELSKQAQANIWLQTGRITLTTFDRSIAIPGLIVENPGRSTAAITAPLTGIVTDIYPIQGEAVRPGQKLFELRLTHEELVQAQGDFLRVAEELDVIGREISRLEKIAAEGAIPGRQVLERQYEQQNKMAVLRAQHQALLLHGLVESQVQNILNTRTLLKSLTVSVPADMEKGASPSPQPKQFEVKELRVTRGQSVTAGDTLAVLTDYSELYIEGNAFDRDVASVNKAVEHGWPISAVLESDERKPDVVGNLRILYVAGNVDPESRTFHFYLTLQNSLVRDIKQSDGHQFISWRYKPGQRVQLDVPVEQWKNCIVLPVEAVAQEGAETYVFVPNGDHFDRKPVHVEYRDRFAVVIKNDGSVFAGDMVVLSGAQQMLLALKNKAGGGIDPHAGHNH